MPPLGEVVLRLHAGRITLHHPTRQFSANVTGGEEMRVRAYLLWEAEGKPEGRLDEYWDRARELNEDESRSSYPPAQSRGHRT